MMPDQAGTAPRRQPFTPVAVALLVLHAGLAWVTRAPGVGTGNDDAAYLLLSRALRQWSYVDAHIVGSPVHSQYPPGFPAFLALLSVAGERFDVYLAAIAMCSVAALWLMWDAIRRVHGEVIAAVTLALCAVNPSLVRFAGLLMSEAPFMALTLLAVWAIVREREARTAADRRRLIGVAIGAACLAALTRSIGVTFLAGLFAYWLLERRFWRAAGLAVAGSVTAGAWLAWTILAPARIVGRSYIADATFVPGESVGFAGMLLRRMAVNLPAYVKSSVPTLLPQPTMSGTSVDNVAGLIVVAVLGVAGAFVAWRGARVVLTYLAAYGALLAIWAWHMTRFLVPLIPFILWVLVLGAFVVGRRRAWLRPLPWVVAALIGGTAISRDVEAIRSASRCDRLNPVASPDCYTDVQRGFLTALAYLRRTTPDTARVLSVKEGVVGYLAGRQVLMPEMADAPDAATLMAELRTRGVGLILLTPLRIARAQHVQVLRQACRELAVEAEFHPVTLLLRVTPADRPERTDACAALERYALENVRWDPEPDGPAG